MGRLKAGIVRYASLSTEIAKALGTMGAPDCRIGHARITLTFRQLGASRWDETRQLAHALHAAATVREILSGDSRRQVRQRSSRAIEVIYLDVAVRRGTAVESRWTCVIPAGE